MVFDTSPPPTSSSSSDRVNSLDQNSSIIELPLSDERSLSQIELENEQQSFTWNSTSKRRQNCTNDIPTTSNRYHQLEALTMNNLSSSAESLIPPLVTSLENFNRKISNDEIISFNSITTRCRSTTDCNNLTSTSMIRHPQQTNKALLIIIDDKSRDSIWPSSDNHHLSISASKSPSITEPPISMFYSDPSMTSYSSSSSVSSFDLNSNSSDLHTSCYIDTRKTASTSSGYNSSLNSIFDQFYPSSPDSMRIPLSTFQIDSDCNLIEQFLDLHLEKQISFDQDIPSSSSLSSSSLYPISTINSPLCCRKCVNNNNHHQLSPDTDDDDSQSTTISTNCLPLQQQQNKRPRSLPIAIQQIKRVINDDDDSSQTSSLCHCSLNSSEKKRFRPCELNIVISADGKLTENKAIDKLQTNTLEHFIMSPTDKVKIQMKYQENDLKNNDLKISQPEDIDFKRSKLKAIRVLYQNRLNLNSMQSPVSNQRLPILPSRTAMGHGDSSLAKRTVNPRLFRSALSCSVFEADDEHEVVSSTTRTGVNGTREKSHSEIFNCLRINFIESLLHGKVLPCGILDGFTVKLGASGLFMPKQVVLPVTTFWFNVSEHQAASPYLGFINLQCLPKRGYHTPTKGTITLALLNPNGTAIHLFLILYDLSDMPPDHRTFIRQRIVFMPENIDNEKKDEQTTVIPSKENLRYLAHIRFVTSQTGKLYMHSDIRLIFARNRLDFDDRTQNRKPQLVTLTDMPTPKYWSRK